MKKIILVTMAKPTLRGVFPDNGLALIASILKKENNEVLILDLASVSGLNHVDDWEDYCYEEISKNIKNFKPDIIGWKTWINDFQATLDVEKRIKLESPSIKMINGGPHVDFFPEIFEDMLCEESPTQTQFIDGIITNEGDLAFPSLMKFEKEEWHNVPFLTFKKDDKIIKTPGKFIEKIDELPFPDFSIETYPSFTDEEKIKLIYREMNRGCAYGKCSFCFHPIKSGHFRSRSTKSLIEETDYYIRNGFNVFRFGNSTTRPEQANEFAKETINNNQKIIYALNGNICFGDEYDYELLKKSGCVGVFYGIESGCNDELSMWNKNVTSDDIRRVIRKNLDADLGAFFSIIYSGNMEAGRKTIDLIKELKPTGVTMLPIMPMPKTDIAINPKKYSIDMADDYFEILAHFSVDLTKKTNEWDTLPYTSHGKDHKELMRETAMLAQELENENIITRVSDENLLLAIITDSSLIEMRENENIFRDKSFKNAKDLVLRINKNIPYEK